MNLRIKKTIRWKIIFFIHSLFPSFFYKYYLNSKTHYVSSFDILANADYDIILMELYPCNSKDELLARERHYKDTLICVDKNRPGIFSELGKKSKLNNIGLTIKNISKNMIKSVLKQNLNAYVVGNIVVPIKHDISEVKNISIL